MQLGGQVRLGQTLQGPGALRPFPNAHLLQRDGGGRAGLHLEELQVRGAPGAAAEARQLPEHHHHLPQARQEHVPHHAQLQLGQLPPLVRLHGAAGVQRGHESLCPLRRGPVGGPNAEMMELWKKREIFQVDPRDPVDPTLPGTNGNSGKLWFCFTGLFCFYPLNCLSFF